MSAPAPVPTVPAPPAPAPAEKHSTTGNVLAIGGRVYATIGAVIGSLIALVLILIGVHELRDKHTASAPMTVVSVAQTTPITVSVTSNGTTQTTTKYASSVHVTFTAADGKKYTAVASVTMPAPVTVGEVITLRYIPADPANSVKQEPSPRALGWGLIVGGVVLAAVTVGAAVLTFKSRTFAQIEGVMGAASMARSIL